MIAESRGKILNNVSLTTLGNLRVLHILPTSTPNPIYLSVTYPNMGQSPIFMILSNKVVLTNPRDGEWNLQPRIGKNFTNV